MVVVAFCCRRADDDDDASLTTTAAGGALGRISKLTRETEVLLLTGLSGGARFATRRTGHHCRPLNTRAVSETYTSYRHRASELCVSFLHDSMYGTDSADISGVCVCV